MNQISLLKNLLNWIPSITIFQRVFKILHTIALRGMNYGGQGTFNSSGELNVLKYLNRRLKAGHFDNPIIFDVGANVGNYALSLDSYFSHQLKIMAFEPAQKTYAELKKNLKNTYVKSFQIGFGDQNMELTLYRGENHSTHASLYQRTTREPAKGVEKVTIKTIDHFCAEEKIESIFFLKLDVEGSEYKALLGANQLIAEKKIQYIQFEFGGTNIDSRVFFRDFWELLHRQYDLFRIVKDGLYPIKSYNESLEIFVYCNYFAQLK